MIEPDNENRIIDLHRDDWMIEDNTNDWTKALTAVILLISALAAIIKRNNDENDRRY